MNWIAVKDTLPPPDVLILLAVHRKLTTGITCTSVKLGMYTLEDIGGVEYDDDGVGYTHFHYFCDKHGEFWYEIDEVDYWCTIPKLPLNTGENHDRH